MFPRESHENTQTLFAHSGNFCRTSTFTRWAPKYSLHYVVTEVISAAAQLKNNFSKLARSGVGVPFSSVIKGLKKLFKSPSQGL